MATIRAKLTVAYAGALLGSVGVFSIALFASRRANTRNEVAREVAVRADQALRVLRFAATTNEPLTTTRDTLFGGAQITRRIADILDGLPDYVMLLDKDGRTLYVSPSVRALQARDPVTTEPAREQLERRGDYERIMRAAIDLEPGM